MDINFRECFSITVKYIGSRFLLKACQFILLTNRREVSCRREATSTLYFMNNWTRAKVQNKIIAP